MERSDVDVIMPAYNSAATIAASIDSVLAQKGVCWRLWVIDDGSTDSTGEVVRRYLHDPRIDLIEQQNTGPAGAWNRGLDRAESEFVAFLGSDDIWEATYLEKMCRALTEDGEAGLAWCEMSCFGDASGLYRGARQPVAGSAADTIPRIYSDVTFLGSAVVCRNRHFRAGLRYPLHYRTMEDVHVWAAIAAEARIVHVPEALVRYRVHDNSLTTAVGSMLRNYGDNVNSYRELYRRYRSQIPHSLYRERMWRAHHYAAEDLMRIGGSGVWQNTKALCYRPLQTVTWKNLLRGLARAALPTRTPHSPEPKSSHQGPGVPYEPTSDSRQRS